MRPYTNWLFPTLLIIMFSCSSPPTDDQSPGVFLHGVASGDPLQDRVVIWTRVTSSEPMEFIEVDWELATDETFNNILKYGKYTTQADRDYTVKVDLKGLNPGTGYFYRFKALDDVSETGKTKTAKMEADSLQFAIVSCSNYEWGYFNTYGRIAERKDLDAVIHLGDYIYEYGTGVYGDTTLGRINDPLHECITLDDYRKRYALYRTDSDLQAVHASHPFITVWDDHEIANDAYVDGAQNHQPDEGDFADRKSAATQAYYEWMPIREGEKHYRKISFGPMADLLMLDERLEGRTKQLDSLSHPEFRSPERSMIGADQLAWFKNELKSSTARWKVIGNQVIFSDMNRELVFPKKPKNLDSWDGYPTEKNEIAKYLISNEIENVVWVTGDTHSSWAFETIVGDVSDDPIAVEFGVTSVNSGNYDEHASLDTARLAEQLFLKANPHLKYSNVADHGYLLLTLTHEKASAAFYYVETVKTPSKSEFLGFETTVLNGERRLE